MIELRNSNLFPENHVNYLRNINYTPKVIYDIGACVLHWTDKARTVWSNAKYYAFEAMSAPKFIYETANLAGYYNGIVTDVDNKTVEYYENVMDPGGNSYYRENPEYSNAVDVLYPEEFKKTVSGFTLDTIVSMNEFDYPDLIKIDVQGAELDILKGADECLMHAKHIIVELQKVEYNKGAPRREEVIEYLKTKNFHLVGDGPFHDAGPDGDYHFIKV